MTEPIEQPVTPAAAPVAPAAAPAPSDELPTWARQKLTEANSEAANYRVQLREAEAARKALEDQVVTLTAASASANKNVSTVQTDFDKLVTAIKAKVPHDHVFAFAKTLQGSNEEELMTHATELKTMFGAASGSSPAVDRLQGHGGAKESATPVSEFTKFFQSQIKR